MNRWCFGALLGFSLIGLGSVVQPPVKAQVVTPEVENAEEAVNEEAVNEEAVDEEAEPRPYNPIRPPMACPADVETLTTLMIRDIPNYTNRVLQRTSAVLQWTEADELRLAAGELVRQAYQPSHVLIAGQVNLEPLDLAEYTYTTSPEAGGPIEQVFFTTRSRQYSQQSFGSVGRDPGSDSSRNINGDISAEDVEEFHWAFLTQTTGGWRLAFMFSSVDDVDNRRTALPPRENSQGSVGQAVQLWLRDCRAGAIYG